MSVLDFFRKSPSPAPSRSIIAPPPPGSFASLSPAGMQAWGSLQTARPSPEVELVKELLSRPARRAGAFSVGVPDFGFKGVRQQLFQRFNLVDLYAIAHNNSVLQDGHRELEARGVSPGSAVGSRVRVSKCEVRTGLFRGGHSGDAAGYSGAVAVRVAAAADVTANAV